MKTMRHELESRIIAKAWRDAQFKAQLLADPKPILEKELGQKIAEGTRVVALEERADVLYLVLPKKPEAQGELSDEELETVASGEAPMPIGGEEPRRGP